MACVPWWLEFLLFKKPIEFHISFSGIMGDIKKPKIFLLSLQYFFLFFPVVIPLPLTGSAISLKGNVKWNWFETFKRGGKVNFFLYGWGTFYNCIRYFKICVYKYVYKLVSFCCFAADSSSQLCKNNWGGQKQTEGFGSTVAGCNWHWGSGEIKLQVDKKD